MKTWVVTNRKGGPGKTAVAVGLASCPAGAAAGPAGGRSAHRILLIDLDVQADASTQVGVEDAGAALAEALEGRAPLEEAIRSTGFGIDLAPAGEALGRLAATARSDALRRALRTLPADRYDLVVVDCAPALDRLTVAAWTAADRLLVPIDGPESLRAATRLRFALEDLALDPARMRLVLTKQDPRRVLDRALREQALALYPDQTARTTVRESTVFPQAAAWRTPLPIYAPHHPAVQDLLTLAQEVRNGVAHSR